jgi:hypothetical protein
MFELRQDFTSRGKIMKVLLSLFFLFTIQFQEPIVDFDNVPTPILKCLQPESHRFEVSRRMNPFYLRGDFNGDGKLDYVVLVQERKSGKQGVAFCFAGAKRKAYVVAAGNAIALEGGILGDDFSDFDVWVVEEAYSKNPKRDALFLEKAEAGSGVLIWNGRRMVWRQLGI